MNTYINELVDSYHIGRKMALHLAGENHPKYGEFHRQQAAIQWGRMHGIVHSHTPMEEFFSVLPRTLALGYGVLSRPAEVAKIIFKPNE